MERIYIHLSGNHIVVLHCHFILATVKKVVSYDCKLLHICVNLHYHNMAWICMYLFVIRLSDFVPIICDILVIMLVMAFHNHIYDLKILKNVFRFVSFIFDILVIMLVMAFHNHIYNLNILKNLFRFVAQRKNIHMLLQKIPSARPLAIGVAAGNAFPDIDTVTASLTAQTATTSCTAVS